MHRFCTLFLALVVCFCTTGTAALAQPPATQEPGQDYIVRPGDSLFGIAAAFYGNGNVWRTIFDATNAKAATDPSYARIENPDIIRPGQKLWIPYRPTSGFPPDPEALRQAYARAISDAAIADPGEISRNLIGITEWEPNLIWQTEAGQRQVLMVAWTSWSGFNDKVGQDTTIDAAEPLWVTSAPELRNFCRAFTRDHPTADLDLRLRQLLGLPPDAPRTTVVEFWVAPQDLFRPAADPEITDHEAELAFRNTIELITADAYESWFNHLRENSYGPNGSPWTRLGYTYDWGNPTNEIGLSEFVIHGGATVHIAAVYTTRDYCA